MKKTLLLIVFLFVCITAAGCGPALVVDSAGDEPDSNLTDGICKTVNNDCTLRAAIMEANVSDDISKISFQNITTINPASPLPPITNNNARIDGGGSVTINGQPNNLEDKVGFEIQDASNVYIQGVTIRNFFQGIKIHSNNGNANNNIIGALPAEGGDLTKRNIIIYNTTGVYISGDQSKDNIISGNHIGIDIDGVSPRPNIFTGIYISGGSNNNIIGSKSGSGILSGGNLISGNGGTGIWISAADQNHISGNYIGSNLDGTAKIENYEGIRISHGSSNNIIGFNQEGEGSLNLIGGNVTNGIAISGSGNTFISGNYIGTSITGSQSLPNTHGVWIDEGAMLNIIGTNGDGVNDQTEGNLISGNFENGINIKHNCISNVIAGNLIGTTIDGLTALGNGWAGIISHGDNTRIGTDGDQTSDQLESNVIGGSGTSAINVSSNFNVIAGNMIGVDQAGMAEIGNAHSGIVVHGDNNLIGTNGDGKSDLIEKNVVGANGEQNHGIGIIIYGNNNIIAGNLVGTDSSGLAILGNRSVGISLQNGAMGNLVGTDGDGISDDLEGNLVSGNGRQGITLYNATSNIIAGNLIGTDITGTSALPNGHNASQIFGAVHLGAGSSLNVIGTNGDGQNDAAEGNLISGNDLIGIIITGTNTQNNAVTGNIIGLDITGTSILGNVGGIYIGTNADNNLIGTNADGKGDDLEGNRIGGNQTVGMLIASSNIHISGNFIGTDKFGTADLGNGGPGINIVEPASDIVVGGSYQKANIIAFNKASGISIQGTSVDNIQILNNSIHSNDKLGINLSSSSGLYDVLINDSGDIDTGPNDLMNYPELNYAHSIIPTMAITGEIIDGLPNTQFEIQFFSNPVCDSPSNHGEGKNYLGSSNQQTDNNGNVQFLVSFPANIPPGSFITSTATSGGKTSEFSGCVEVQETQTYSQEEDPCDQFDPDLMTITTFEVRPDSGLFIIYVKNLVPFPLIGPGNVELEYYASIGDASTKCSFEGFDDRAYCYFYIPETYYNTKQLFILNSNFCLPLYVNEEVGIFAKDPDNPTAPSDPSEPGEGSCHEDLGQRACIAVGGIYSATTNKCICPRR